MSYDPSQPRDENGEWTDGSGSPTRRLSIDQSANALRQQGWEVGKPVPWQPGDKETKYHVTHIATGKTHIKTAHDIIRKVP